MARTKDQAARRQQLVHATIELIADRGIEALTLAAIADHVGVSHRLVAYYYADLDSLVQEAYEAAVERYYWERLRTLDQAAEPAPRLLQLMRSGLPGPHDRRLSQVLNEMSVSASRNGVHAALMARLFDREVSLYLAVLEDGQASGSFTAHPARSDRRPQPGRARGRLRLPPARGDVAGGRGHGA